MNAYAVKSADDYFSRLDSDAAFRRQMIDQQRNIGRN